LSCNFILSVHFVDNIPLDTNCYSCLKDIWICCSASFTFSKFSKFKIHIQHLF
jgi:hypothetical protein